MRKDGSQDPCSSVSTWRRIAWMFMFDPLVRASPSRAMARVSRNWQAAEHHDAESDRARSDRRLRDRCGGGLGCGRPDRGGRHPRQIRDFTRATARLDATVIAHFAEAVNPPVRPLADPQQRLLGELMTRRRQLIEMMVAQGEVCGFTFSESALAVSAPSSPALASCSRTHQCPLAHPRAGRRRP